MTQERALRIGERPAEDFKKHADLFAFAGWYDRWQDPKTRTEIRSYTIITTAANGRVGKIHHRMPVILRKRMKMCGLILTLLSRNGYCRF
jgi:hypothetical protein